MVLRLRFANTVQIRLYILPVSLFSLGAGENAVPPKVTGHESATKCMTHIFRRNFEFGSCTCRGVRSSFAVESSMNFQSYRQKPHCRLSVVNYNQTVILLLSLLNILCKDSEPFGHSSSPIRYSYGPCC